MLMVGSLANHIRTDASSSSTFSEIRSAKNERDLH